MPVMSAPRTIRFAVALVLVGSALILVGTGPATAGTTCELTVPVVPAAPNNVIPDGSTHTSTIDVPEDGFAVTDLDVSVDLHHPADEDLSISLQWLDDAESGSPVAATLFDGSGSGANLLGTVFDDGATQTLASGTAPFTGRFQPEQPLSALVGHAGGKYRLVIADDPVMDGDAGVLDHWALTLRYATCDLDTDAVEDHVDSCPAAGGGGLSGCPVATRHLSASYRNGKFRGLLSSTVPACRSGQAVTLWKVRPGADRKIGTRTTAPDGTYKLRRARHAGRYYATSAGVILANVAECPAVRSRTFRIR